MDGVGEEGHGAAESDNDRLQDGRGEQDEQTDLERPYARLVRFQRVIDRVRCVVGVRDEEPVKEPLHSGGLTAIAQLPDT